jgi:CRP/FNR family transcriptional regulator, cyclic AMP receptor protein
MKTAVRALIRNQRLFQSCEDRTVEMAISMARIVELEPDEIVCLQGDHRSPMVLVLSGQLRACGSSHEGREVHLFSIASGRSVGAGYILPDVPVEFHIIATQKSVVAILTREQARQIFMDPSVARTLNLVLSERLNVLARLASEQGVQRAVSRVSAVIASAISESNGDSTEALQLPKQATIAALAGVSRETVSREIATLCRRGIIAKQGRQVFVRDPAALQTIARSPN